jgi:hypothetical protein
MNLSQLVGHSLAILIPRMGSDLHTVELVGVEAHGIWIKSEAFTDAIHSSAGSRAALPSVKNARFFVPFPEIAVVMYSAGQA